MPQTYKDKPAYKSYRAGNEAGERDDAKMPDLKKDGNDKVIIVPGEVFCRWRDEENGLCYRSAAFYSPSSLRNHYKKGHGLQVSDRGAGSKSVALQHQLNRWYSQVDAGAKPTWVPDELQTQPPPANSSNNTSNNTDENVGENDFGGSSENDSQSDSDDDIEIIEKGKEGVEEDGERDEEEDGDDFEEDGEEDEDDMEEDGEETGDDMEEDGEETGDDMEEDGEETGDDMEEDEEVVEKN
ncbi:uncharacterized protein TRIREDRAFT_107197 [Trichoderma reesei QM6a]|uniref:Predicted protein n=2 Tax=Hypocrea jecorina TaxID=51453 RepID=G0RIR2_HYPJQ|nr:uncharacterized protein TRIREDRAFT_107197 [Trichoderma reesei QM6a]EGR49051.1 predicted protein [Trichoderma reesei QM6a]ETS02268.1 hypothetical protein M419DRAFT_77509 [Trichoderma reesei RUT C-30]